jgi:hypothetical protein
LVLPWRPTGTHPVASVASMHSTTMPVRMNAPRRRRRPAVDNPPSANPVQGRARGGRAVPLRSALPPASPVAWSLRRCAASRSAALPPSAAGHRPSDAQRCSGSGRGISAPLAPSRRRRGGPSGRPGDPTSAERDDPCARTS